MIRLILVLCGLLGYGYAQSNAKASCAGSGGSFIADVSACDQYFWCANDTASPIAGACPAPYKFNVKQQQCDWEENVQCVSCPSTPAFTNLPVDGSCTDFIRCFNGQAQQMTCPDGLYFDKSIGECNVADQVDCTPVVCPPTSDKPIFVRDPQECANYYICVNGQQLKHTCPTPLVFNTNISTCDFRNNTDCPAPPVDPNPPSPDPNPPPPDPIPNPPGTNPSTIPISFYCTHDGIFPHPTSCTQYIICTGASAYQINCPSGLHYNANSQTCSYPKSGTTCTHLGY